jgi:hypothetical protein
LPHEAGYCIPRLDVHSANKVLCCRFIKVETKNTTRKEQQTTNGVIPSKGEHEHRQEMRAHITTEWGFHPGGRTSEVSFFLVASSHILVVALVEGVDLAGLRDLDVGVRHHKLADQGSSVKPAACTRTHFEWLYMPCIPSRFPAGKS